MTCAHIVNVALRKLPGVESVDVSLNKALVATKLKPSNKITVSQMWWLLHEKGYTPRETVVVARGTLEAANGGVQLRLSGSNEALALAAGPKNPGSPAALQMRLGQVVTLKGVMLPTKNLKAGVPLQVDEIQ